MAGLGCSCISHSRQVFFYHVFEFVASTKYNIMFDLFNPNKSPVFDIVEVAPQNYMWGFSD